MINQMSYSQLIELLQGTIQNWGGEYNTNIIKPIVKNVSIPQVANRYFWPNLTKPYSKTLTIGTDTYDLPYDFDKFKWLKSKYGELVQLDPRNFHAHYPDRSDNQAQDIGTFTVEEFMGVKNQISTAEKVDVVSNSASDTQTVLIRGEVDGFDDYEEITLNGTTTVTTTKTFTSIQYVSKSEKTVGIVTLTGNTSATVLTKIAPEHITATYKRMILSAIPSEALTLVGEYMSETYIPQRDYDVLRVPADLVFMHALMILGWERRDAAAQQTMKDMFDSEVNIAINKTGKSLNVKSSMTLDSPGRRVIQNDHPLYYN